MPLTSTSLTSQLHLRFAATEGGPTRLTHRQAGGLCHIGKPYWDGRVLLTQLINPTAGLFAGDRLEAAIELGEHSSVLLSSPSATRLHTMESGSSKVTQTFHLGPRSWLEVLPDLLIPQAAAHASIRTRIELHPSASLVFLDLLAPGRTAHGESLAFHHLATALDIIRDGIPIVRERARLTPGGDSWRLQNPAGKPASVATLWLHLPDVGDLPELLAEIEAARSCENLQLGATLLDPHLAAIRLLTPDSLLLRNSLLEIRRQLATRLPCLRSRSGKL